MTTYIAGPMTGLPEFNYPKFHAVAAELRSRGVDVRCPTDNDDGSTDEPWDFCMRLAIKQLLECDEIALLPGWSSSRGAQLERRIATELGMTISLWDDTTMTVKEVTQ